MHMHIPHLSGNHNPLAIGSHMVPVVKYYEKMGNCKFCLIPKGVGFTNGRVFETFFSGCIPVVLSDSAAV